ncbi:dihydrofolate reductase [candidate division KSB1 bacterium]|nr:dihydrofolate reductase [candidate division KSB1 bacterium]
MKIIIAAMGANRVIGAGNRLPWRVPEEYHHFLTLITDQTVIMGRVTYEIFSKDLPSKRNLIVSRGHKRYERATVFNSFAAALKEAERYPEDIFFAGGATIYEWALDVADKMYLSYIKGDFDGDTFFPSFDETNWLVERRIEYPAFQFVQYSKR